MEEILAIGHLQRRLNPTNAIHGTVLAVAQATGSNTSLIIANPNAGALQTIGGGLTVTGAVSLTNTLAVTNGTTLSSTLSVAALATLSAGALIGNGQALAWRNGANTNNINVLVMDTNNTVTFQSGPLGSAQGAMNIISNNNMVIKNTATGTSAAAAGNINIQADGSIILQNMAGTVTKMFWDTNGNASLLGTLNINSGKFIVDATTGNTTVTGTLAVTGSATFSAGQLYSNNPFNFLTVAGVAQHVNSGGLLASDNYGDQSLVPSLGIYAKGDIKTAGNLIIAGNTTIGGNLVVNGTTTTVNSATLLVNDRMIHLNEPSTKGSNDPVPLDYAGVSVYRGSNNGVVRDSAAMAWDEVGQKWLVTLLAQDTEVTLGANRLDLGARSIDTTGSVAIGTTLAVTGATALSSSLTVTGNSQFNAQMTSTQASAGVALAVLTTGDSASRFYIQNDGSLHWGPGGASAPDTSLSRTGGNALTASGNLTVLGATTLTGSLTLGNAIIQCAGAVDILNGNVAQGVNMGQLLVSYNYGDVSLVPSNGAFIRGGTHLASTLTVDGSATLNGNTTLTGAAALTVGGAVSVGGTLNVTAATVLNSTLAVTGTSSFTGTVTTNSIVADGPIYIQGQTGGLPVSVANSAVLVGGYGSPISGKLFIGDGSGWHFSIARRLNSVDTDLFTFNDNGTLNVGGSLTVGTTLSVASNSAFNGQMTNQQASTAVALAVLATGDTASRFYIQNDGSLHWGPGGAAATDTSLSRSGVNSLTTPGNLTVSGTLTTSGTQSIIGNLIVSGTTTLQNNVTVGDDNQDVLYQQAVLAEVDTRSQTLTYNADGSINIITESDGTTTVKTTTFSYNADGTVNTATTAVGGKTITRAYSYDGAGNLTGMSKTVA